MKSKLIITIIISFIVAIYLMTTTLTSGGNQIGSMMKIFSYGILLISFGRPMFGFWALILSLGYIDTIKRLLVLGDYINFLDVTYLLAFPPILSVVMFAGILFKLLTARQLKGANLKLLKGCFAVMILLSANLATKGGSILGLLQSIANNLGYVPLIFIIPFLFPSKLELVKMLRTVIFIYVPVGIYAIYQKHVGFLDFEIAYLETGYSLEQRILFGQDFRCFSTLNSSPSLAKFAGMMAVLTLYLPRCVPGSIRNILPIWVKLALFALFFYAAMISGARAGVMMALFALVCFWVLRSRLLTMASYIAAGALFVGMLLVAESIVEDRLLHDWSNWLVVNKPEWVPFETNLSTLTIRFIGFSQWTKPDFWQPFGYALSDVDYKFLFPHHDTFTAIMLKVGYIPILIVLVGSSFFLHKMHSTIWNSSQFDSIKPLMVALIFSVVFGSLTGANLTNFPINTLFYMFMGCYAAVRKDELNSLILRSLKAREDKEELEFTEKLETLNA